MELTAEASASSAAAMEVLEALCLALSALSVLLKLSGTHVTLVHDNLVAV